MIPCKWKASNNTERTAQSKYSDWATSGEKQVVLVGRLADITCCLVFPVENGNTILLGEGRWVPFDKITLMKAKEK